jgi:parallel beta-helix repeat protein
MNKKYFPIIVFIGFFLILTACAGSTGSNQVDSPTKIPPIPTPTTEISGIHLSADGSGDYPKLETAIIQAEAGETIILEAGTYRLDKILEIDNSITIIGAGMDETIIASNVTGTVLHFIGDGAYTLEGITVQHEGEIPAHAVVVENGQIDFSNCHFTGASGATNNTSAGVMIRGTATGTVKDCLIDNNATAAIYLAGEANILMEGITCTDNRELGIAFRENAGGTVKDNVCNKNGEAGFYIDSNGTILLEGNECSHNGSEESSGVGILVGGEANPTIEKNTCNGNKNAGISFGQFAGGNIKNNECTFNGFAGINVEDEAKPNLEGNTCSKNGADELGVGIAYFENSGGVAKNNTLRENKRDGILVMHDAAPELLENDCSMNQKFGIFYSGNQGGSAIKNQCAFNNWFGIYVSENSQPLLQENICNNNQAGIFIEDTANPELVDNDLYGNLKDNLVDPR